MKASPYYLVAFFVALAVASTWHAQVRVPRAVAEETIGSFAQCVAAGHMVLDGHPRRCVVSDGTHFIEPDLTEGVYDDESDRAGRAGGGALDRVRFDAAQAGSVAEADVWILSIEPRVWSNACLGLAAHDEQCAEVLTPGYQIFVLMQGILLVYRSNADGTELRVE